MGTRRMTAAERIARERQVWELRQAGVPFEAIARQLGFHDRAGAKKAFDRYLGRLEVVSQEQQQKLQIARLERLHQALWPRALKGDVPAVREVLKISEQLRAMQRLDSDAPAAPTPGPDPVDEIGARRAARIAEA